MLTTEELLKKRTLGNTNFSEGGLSSFGSPSINNVSNKTALQNLGIPDISAGSDRNLLSTMGNMPFTGYNQSRERTFTQPDKGPVTNIGGKPFTGVNENVQGGGFLDSILGSSGGATTADGTILNKNKPATGNNFNFLPGETVDDYKKRIESFRSTTGGLDETTSTTGDNNQLGLNPGDVGYEDYMKGLGLTPTPEGLTGTPTIKGTTSSDVMDAIRKLNTTAEGLQVELNQIKDLPTDTSTGEKKDDYDSQLKQLQLQITQKILASMDAPEGDTIMDKYADREQQLRDASDAAKQLIESRTATAIEDEETAGSRRLESEREARRGFATNRAMFTQMEEVTAKRVRDLGIARDDALASQNFSLAESLSDLIGKEEESITKARQQNLDNLMALSGELRSLRGFETPEEKRTAEGFETPAESREAGFQNSLALLGATRSIDYDIKQAENLQNIKTNYANVDGMSEATSIEQAIGLMGPELAKDVNLARQLDEARLSQINAATMASFSSAGGKELNASQVQMFSDAKFLPSMLGDIKDFIDEGTIGVGSGINIFGAGNKEATTKLDMTAQLIGRFLEGGKLSDEDYKSKYRKFLPSISDASWIAKAKLEAVNKMLGMKYNGYITDYSNTGYDVSGFPPLEVTSLWGDTTSNNNNDNDDPFTGLDQ